MKNCKQCRLELGDSDKFCPSCGSKNVTTEQQPVQLPYMPQLPYGALQNTTGMLVFSILVTVIFMPLGIVAIVYTISAKNALTQYDFERNIHNAKIANIIGAFNITVLLAVNLVFAFAKFNSY